MASVFETQEQVMEALWDEPEGLKPCDLLRRFWSGRWGDVNLAVYRLLKRGLIHKVDVAHGTDEGHKDHARLMVLRERGVA
jgi:hypothetical protein